MPIFDFVCSECSAVTEEIVRTHAVEFIKCSKCGAIADKMFPDTMRFELLYDPKRDTVGWSNDGFSRTRRFEEYDKQSK
jgi:putative FmdB family regulatory protein